MSSLKFGSKGFYGLVALRLDDLLPTTIQHADWEDIRQDALCRVLQYRKSHFTSAFVRACVERSVRHWRRVRSRTAMLTPFDSLDSSTSNDIRQGEISDLERIYLRTDFEKIQEELTPLQLQICQMLVNDQAPRRIAQNLQVSPRVIRSEMDIVRLKIEQAGYSH